MSENTSERFWRMTNPIMWSALASLGFLLLILFFAFAPTCNNELFKHGVCPAKWAHIYVAKPNEVGDTLAGLAGVFAFIWLIGTVLLQATELREQRKEFREQRRATQAMANSMAAQAKLIEDERLERKQRRAGQLLNQRLIGLANLFIDTPPLRIQAKLSDKANDKEYETHFELGSELTSSEDLEWVYKSLFRELREQVSHRNLQQKEGLTHKDFEYDVSRVNEIDCLLKEIVKGIGYLSDADKQKVSNLRIEQIFSLFGEWADFGEEDT